MVALAVAIVNIAVVPSYAVAAVFGLRVSAPAVLTSNLNFDFTISYITMSHFMTDTYVTSDLRSNLKAASLTKSP